MGLHSIDHHAEPDIEANDTFWPIYRSRMETMARERGFPCPDRFHYQRGIETGALLVGSPDTVARKVAESTLTLGLSRFDLKYDTLGTSVHDRTQTVDLQPPAWNPRRLRYGGPAAW